MTLAHLHTQSKLAACVVLGIALLSIPNVTAQEKGGTDRANSARKPRSLPKLPGIQTDGNILLNTQWSLKPAGKQLVVGDFPVNIAIHPSGKWGAVLHAGYGEHEVIGVDLSQFKVVSRAPIPQAFYGICFDQKGEHVYASGGEHEVVHEFKFAEGYLAGHREIVVADKKQKLVVAGVTLAPSGDSLFVCGAWGHTLLQVPIQAGAPKPVALPKDSYPYASVVSKNGGRLYVSLWGAAQVAVLNATSLEVEATWKTDSHPTEMVETADGELLFVSCANSNHVNVIETSSGKTLETISSALFAQAKPGSTPNSIALSPDGRVLLVASADNNNVAVVDVSERGRSRSLGFVPVGWYPTSVRFSDDGKRIFVANGKGLMSKSNRNGPNPLSPSVKTVEEYIGKLFTGTISVIDSPSPAEMAKLTRQAFACSPLREDEAPVAKPRSEKNPVPAKLGAPSPIKHCIYIIKENRTYDQVFGDMPEGNGDPTICIFPEKVTPNHHAIAREFVLLDNFYVESEVSADGHEWSMAAYASDFVEKSWPLSYRGGLGKLTYPSEGAYPIAFSGGGYIWDRCKEANVSYRSYGEFIANGATPNDPSKATMPALEGHFDPGFRGYDLDYPDQKRADRFIEELKRYEQEGDFPQFIVLRLPNDHTHGTRIGKKTPTAMVADNDLALGRVIEALSNSKFWKETAVFVIQDDAQNGSDHVDAHRTVALVVSPYTRRGIVDSNLYSTASMLRTMELILGLKPMTQFDAAALPMYDSFADEPNLTPYKHRPAGVSVESVNTALAWGADVSEKLDFSKEDAADDLLLNEIVWRSVRGPNSAMPAPVRAAFVFAHPEEEEDDDDDEGENRRDK